jgi:sterol desaturase/sphingolipid hydroxylase (fatty acid hydroxylase superfamily)
MGAWLENAAPSEIARVVFGLFFGMCVVSSALGFALERLMRGQRIWALPLHPDQLRLELTGNVVFLIVQTVALSAVLASGLPRYGAPSWPFGVATFFALMLGFQIYYYFLHRAMHTRSLVRFHRWHHKSRVTTPLSGQSVSFVEALGWAAGYALLPALASHVIPISAEGWAAYLAFNVFGNVVGHSNVELVPVTAGLRAASLFSNTFTFHALHHARWTGHYSFQSALMDRLFRTEWKDWQSLHAEVAAGKPLASVRETRD